jgi:hypothetical protein
MGYLSILKDTPNGVRDLCWNGWAKGKVFNLFMQATTGLVTLTVNAIMKGLLNGLQKYQRAKYITFEASNIMLSIFLCQFLNVAFVPWLALFRFGDHTPSIILT